MIVRVNKKVLKRITYGVLMLGVVLGAVGGKIYAEVRNTKVETSVHVVYVSKPYTNLPEVQKRSVKYEVQTETVIVEDEQLHLKSIGEFILTAYCPCSKCCDQYGASPVNKTTALGVGCYENITIAVDPKVIPYGTKVYIEGLGVRIATDCGGAIKGNRIDVYYTDHKEALNTGLAFTPKQVYIIEDHKEE